MEKNTYPIDQLTSLLDDEGHDVMIMADLKNSELASKVESLKPKFQEAFDKFAKEVSLAADSTLSNVKVKAILVIT